MEPAGRRGLRDRSAPKACRGQLGRKARKGRPVSLPLRNEFEGLPCQSTRWTRYDRRQPLDRSYGSHPGTTTGSGYNGMGLACIRADDLEPNDTRPQATDATPFVSGGFRWVSGTISPPGNDDWYKLTGVDLGGNVILLDSVRSLMDVYRRRHTGRCRHGVLHHVCGRCGLGDSRLRRPA